MAADIADSRTLRFLEQYALLVIPAAELRSRISVGLEQADRGEHRDGEEVFRELEARLDRLTALQRS